MNDTPITDALCAKLSRSKKTDWEKWQITASHAADLERQLAEAREQRDALVDQCKALLKSEEVQKAWPIDGLKRAEKPSDTHSSATATVKFRRLLAIHQTLAAAKGSAHE